ncbi:unnamed protein product [Rangifer tarandus platyrhynchus]|uniref:Uncharacterized protein n=3 Tax=Rangifer tarandus platyrhynchus TaxID=3082113 RepID=A0ABN8ZRR2_RANTA|nr:unnamed protein product [Rangifer tarandus platyrhynchus]CAI9709319.1 unnamed protein product [Rangifer tarandus platyrhynchus]
MSAAHRPSRRFRRGGSQSFHSGRLPDLPWLCARGLRPVNVPVSIPPSGMLAHPCTSSRTVGLSRPGRATDFELWAAPASVCPGNAPGALGPPSRSAWRVRLTS